jgi:Glycosyltransferase family 9 (heptosyltransferase)
VIWWQRYPSHTVVDRMRAVRDLGRLLAFSRQALIAMAPATFQMREVIAADVVDAVLTTLGDGVPSRMPLLDAGLRRLLARLRERLEAVLAGVAEISDLRFKGSLALATIARLEDDYASARAHLSWASNRVSLMQSYDLRERVLVNALSMALASGPIAPSAFGLLKYLFGRRQARPMQPETHALLALIAPRASILASAGLPRSARVLRRWSSLLGRQPRMLMPRLAYLQLGLLGGRSLAKDLAALPEARRLPRVVRAMGGVGDMLMMTPGLRTLAKRAGQPVEFAAPERFRPLLAGNDNVAFRAVEELDDAWWQAGPIIDLTDCPAAATESRAAPQVRHDRIGIFAAAMGVAERELLTTGDRPVFEPLPEDAQAATLWLEERGLSPRGFIAVQASSAEAYRDYPHMPALSARLAGMLPVVVVHDRPLPGYTALGLHTAFNLPLGVALALGSAARLIVAPDSSFVHLSAARDIPLVAIFGPIDGEVRTRRHPRARVVSQADRMACVPCWRNAHTVCKASGTLRSVCMHSLPVDTVVAAVNEELARLA